MEAVRVNAFHIYRFSKICYIPDGNYLSGPSSWSLSMLKSFAVLLPIIAGICWGIAGVFVRTLSAAGFTVSAIISIRLWISSLILFLAILVIDKSMLRIRMKDFPVFAAASLMGTGGLNLFYNVAVLRVSLSLAAVLLGLAPIFVLLFSVPLFKERLTPRKIGCMFAAIFGCVLVSGLPESGGLDNASWSGVLLALAAAFCYGIYNVMSTVASRRGYHSLTISFYSNFLFSLFLLPKLDFALYGRFLAEAPLKNGLILFLNSFLLSALPYALLNLSFSFVETGKASLLAAGAEPAAAFLFGIFFFGELPSLLSFAGLVITIAALTILCLPEQPADIRPEG